MEDAKKFNFKALFYTALFLLPQALYLREASAVSHQASKVIESRRSVVWNNKQVDFIIVRSKMASGRMQASFELEEGRSLLGASLPVLLARDSNGDGKLDVWFTVDRAGVRDTWDWSSKTKDGWDVAEKLIVNLKLLDHFSWPDFFASVAASPLLLVNVFSSSHVQSFYREVIADTLDLKELEIVVSRQAKRNPHSPRLTEQLSALTQGWSLLSRRIEAHKLGHVGYSIADGGILIAFRAVSTGASGAFSWVGSKFSESALKTWSVGLMEGISARLPNVSAPAWWSRLGLSEKLMKPVGVPVVVQLTAQTINQARVAVQSKVLAYSAESRAAQALGSGLSKFTKVVKDGAQQWKYIGLTEAMQIAAEALDNRDIVFNEGYAPWIVVPKLATNPSTVQNVMYMTNETFWMSGVAANSQMGFAKKFTVCSMIAAGDSAFMNVVVKKEMDNGRIALDTGWEMIVGNLQVQFDQWAINGMPSLFKKKIPGLRLVGYALATADQFSGYYFYSMATKKYRESREAKAQRENKKPEDLEEYIVLPVYEELRTRD